MKLELIMLDNPIIVSDEEIKIFDKAWNDSVGKILTCTEVFKPHGQKIIAQSHQIDWNGLESEFGYVDVEKLAGKYYGTDDYAPESRAGFIKGFKKAQELNDKKLSPKDQRHLEWVFERLVHVHGENENYDYMIKLREIINSLSQPKLFKIEVEMEAYCILCDKGSDKTNRCKQVKGQIRQCHIELDVTPKITNGKIKIIRKL